MRRFYNKKIGVEKRLVNANLAQTIGVAGGGGGGKGPGRPPNQNSTNDKKL